MISGGCCKAPRNGRITVLLSGLEFCVNSSRLRPMRHSLRLPCSPCRLNKIGKNPNLVAHREEDLGSESKTINAVVNALAEQAAHASASEESVSTRIRIIFI